MKEIILKSRIHGQKATQVDDEDYDWLNQWKWSVIRVGRNNIYAQRVISPHGKRVLNTMHRVILGLKEREICDHKDGNGLNNQRSNLRKATRSQNGANILKRSITSSKYLGVTKWGKKWKAQIKFNGSIVYIGVFKIEEDAAFAYNESAKKYHGEFASLNIIPSSHSKTSTRAKRHKWIKGGFPQLCEICGILRHTKTFKTRTAIVNHPPWEIFKYETKMVYVDAIKTTRVRPECI